MSWASRLALGRGQWWLVGADLRHSAGRTALAAGLLAAGVVGIAFFRSETGRKADELRAEYASRTGAATVLVDLDGVPDEQVRAIEDGVRQLSGVRRVDAPLVGRDVGVTADVSALVFGNDRQQEFLGARTTVLGVDRAFDPAAGYSAAIGGTDRFIALLPGAGRLDPPGRGEVLLPEAVASYVGLTPGTEVTVDLTYPGVDPPISRSLTGLRVVGTFQMTGPERESVDPFWRLAARGHEILTVRRDDSPSRALTTVPVVIDRAAVQRFLDDVTVELAARGQSVDLTGRRLLVTATDLREVPKLQRRLPGVLHARGVGAAGRSDASGGTFRMSTPADVDHHAALVAAERIGQGAGPIVALLLALVAIGTGAIQAQLAIGRWRTTAVLGALGFSRGRIIALGATQFGVVLAGAVLPVVCVLAMWRDRLAGSDVVSAVALCAGAATLAAVPAIVWPTLPQSTALLGER